MLFNFKVTLKSLKSQKYNTDKNRENPSVCVIRLRLLFSLCTRTPENEFSHSGSKAITVSAKR